MAACEAQIHYYREDAGVNVPIGTGPSCEKKAGHQGKHAPTKGVAIHPTKIADWE